MKKQVWNFLLAGLSLCVVACADPPVDLTNKVISEIVAEVDEKIMTRGMVPGSEVGLKIKVILQKEDGSLQTVRGDDLDTGQLDIRVTDGKWSGGKLKLNVTNTTAWREGYTVSIGVKENAFEGYTAHYDVDWRGFKSYEFPRNDTKAGPDLTMHTARVFAHDQYWRLTKVVDLKRDNPYWVFSQEGVPLTLTSKGAQGSRGSSGGTCQNGGRGGPGGDGGDIVNYYYSYDAQSFFTLDSQGGPGGSGGSGGPSRSETKYRSGCRAGSSGPSGSRGADGVTRNITATLDDIAAEMEGVDLDGGQFVE